MEFPITVADQEAFNALVKSRLDREKTKQDALEAQVAQLTAEKQDLETKASAAEARATTAEQWKAEREADDQLANLRAEVAKKFEISADVLRGSTEEELTAHAELLKPLLTGPKGPIIPNQGNQPDGPSLSDEAAFAKSLFGGD